MPRPKANPNTGEIVDGVEYTIEKLPDDLINNPDTDIVPAEVAVPQIGDMFMQVLKKAQVDFLMQRTPKSEIKMRKGRGKDAQGNDLQFAYVEHGYVTERLNMIFGFNWDFLVMDKQILEDEVVVECMLIVRTPGGQEIRKTQFGGADIKRWSYGPKNGRPLSIADDYKAACSDALKKCATMLGIGLDLYGKDRLIEPADYDGPVEAPRAVQAPRQNAPTSKTYPPVEKRGSGADTHYTNGFASTSQLNAIRSIAKRLDWDEAFICENLDVEKLEQLTVEEASRAISQLQKRDRS